MSVERIWTHFTAFCTSTTVQPVRRAHWWLRDSSTITTDSRYDIETLKRELHWDKTKDEATSIVDRCGFPLLCYAVLGNHLTAVKSILKSYRKSSNLLSWRAPSSGVIEVGVPGHGTILGGAMIFASSDVVIALLQAGVNVYVVLEPLFHSSLYSHNTHSCHLHNSDLVSFSYITYIHS